MTIEKKEIRPSDKPPIRLTIGIPTWNRSERLAEQLSRISKWLAPNVELLVIDNASSDNTWTQLDAWWSSHQGVSATLIRNGVNLGADENYLRVIEAASGEWVWLVGDDDDIDFSIVGAVIRCIVRAKADLVLLVDDNEVCDRTWESGQLIDLNPDEFFKTERDALGLVMLQVGRVICRRRSAEPLLQGAHANAVGMLHAYSYIYGRLLCSRGVSAWRLPLFPGKDGLARRPRWNLMLGYLGAWKSSLIAYPGFRTAAAAREVRLRERALLAQLIAVEGSGTSVEWKELSWMFRNFSGNGKVILACLVCGFRVSRRMTIAVLQLVRPTIVARSPDTKSNVDTGY